MSTVDYNIATHGTYSNCLQSRMYINWICTQTNGIPYLYLQNTPFDKLYSLHKAESLEFIPYIAYYSWRKSFTVSLHYPHCWKTFVFTSYDKLSLYLHTKLYQNLHSCKVIHKNHETFSLQIISNIWKLLLQQMSIYSELCTKLVLITKIYYWNHHKNMPYLFACLSASHLCHAHIP